MPAGSVPQYVPDGIEALISNDLNQAGEALSLDLFQDPQVSEIRPVALSFPRLPTMITRVGVGGVGRDDVADPTEQAARANPQAWGDDEPQYTGQEATVIELSNSRDDRA